MLSSRSATRYLLLCCVLLAVLLTIAHAGEVRGDARTTTLSHSTTVSPILDLDIRFALIVIVSLCISIVVEALVLCYWLPADWSQALRWSLAMNAASGVVFLALWLVLGADGGWKSALYLGEHSRLFGYFARSYLFAVAVESIVLIRLSGKSATPVRRVLGMGAVANLFSYGICFVLLVALLACTIIKDYYA